MGKLPAFQFYPGDWIQDGVFGCSLQAQGLWINLMLLMHSSERRGYLVVNGRPMPEQFIVNKIGSGLTVDLYRTLLTELFDANVPRKTSEGAIYNKRMVSDEKERQNTRTRVAKHRGKSNADVTADVTRMYEDEEERDVGCDVVLDLKKPDFKELVYSAYPRKVGKAKALEAIGKALVKIQKAHKIQEIDAAEYLHKIVLEFARSSAGTKGEYTPHCSTWMNGERWNDDQIEWNREVTNGKDHIADRESGVIASVQEFARSRTRDLDSSGTGKARAALGENAGKVSSAAAGSTTG